MNLKPYKKKKLKSIFVNELLFILIGLIVSFVIIEKASKRYNQAYMDIAISKTRTVITKLINDSSKGISFNKKLYHIDSASDSDIKFISYNSDEAKNLLNTITDNIQKELNEYTDNKNYIILDMPFGIIFKNALLRNLGPTIHVRVNIVGDIITELNTVVKPYGINNSLIELTANIKANIQVILPLSSQDITINNNIPISINVINGKVPSGFISSYH